MPWGGGGGGGGGILNPHGTGISRYPGTKDHKSELNKSRCDYNKVYGDVRGKNRLKKKDVKRWRDNRLFLPFPRLLALHIANVQSTKNIVVRGNPSAGLWAAEPAFGR